MVLVSKNLTQLRIKVSGTYTNVLGTHFISLTDPPHIYFVYIFITLLVYLNFIMSFTFSYAHFSFFNLSLPSLQLLLVIYICIKTWWSRYRLDFFKKEISGGNVVVPGIPGLRAVPDLVTIHPILPPTVHLHPCNTASQMQPTSRS